MSLIMLIDYLRRRVRLTADAGMSCNISGW
jgi:hypothetical protein